MRIASGKQQVAATLAHHKPLLNTLANERAIGSVCWENDTIGYIQRHLFGMRTIETIRPPKQGGFVAKRWHTMVHQAREWHLKVLTAAGLTTPLPNGAYPEKGTKARKEYEAYAYSLAYKVGSVINEEPLLVTLSELAIGDDAPADNFEVGALLKTLRKQEGRLNSLAVHDRLKMLKAEKREYTPYVCIHKGKRTLHVLEKGTGPIGLYNDKIYAIRQRCLRFQAWRGKADLDIAEARLVAYQNRRDLGKLIKKEEVSFLFNNFRLNNAAHPFKRSQILDGINALGRTISNEAANAIAEDLKSRNIEHIAYVRRHFCGGPTIEVVTKNGGGNKLQRWQREKAFRLQCQKVRFLCRLGAAAQGKEAIANTLKGTSYTIVQQRKQNRPLAIFCRAFDGSDRIPSSKHSGLEVINNNARLLGDSNVVQYSKILVRADIDHQVYIQKGSRLLTTKKKGRAAKLRVIHAPLPGSIASEKWGSAAYKIQKAWVRFLVKAGYAATNDEAVKEYKKKIRKEVKALAATDAGRTLSLIRFDTTANPGWFKHHQTGLNEEYADRQAHILQ